MIDSNPKIVFVHQGISWYLPYALHQAKSVSPASEVILLGQELGDNTITSISFQGLQGSKAEVAFNRAYVHLSTNPESFERICFLRWYYLLQYMRTNNVHSVFCFDSDVLLYSSVFEIMDKYDLKNADCGCLLFGIDSKFYAASAGTSFWTRYALEQFCDFIVRCYSQVDLLARLKSLYSVFGDEGRVGGICDMTVLHMFLSERHVSSCNLLIDNDGNIFDQNINQGLDCGAGKFDLVCGKKRVEFVNSKPMVFRNGTPVRAHLLHFQGQAKGHMPLFYTGKNFRGKISSDLKGFAYRLRGDICGKKF